MLLLPFSRLLCLWLCSEAVASQFHWKTKTTFSPHYESTAADRNVQSRRWRTVTGEDNGRTQAQAQASWLDTVNPSPPERLGTPAPRRTVRKNDAQNGARRIRLVPGDEALRTDVNKAGEPRRGGCRPGEVFTQTPHGRTCSLGRSGHHRRQRRRAKPGRKKRSEPLQDGTAWEDLPAAMAQEQEAEPPFGLNTSDYEEEYSVPDYPDTTPFVPVNTRTRRKQVKNPFYPVTAESYGAYAVMIIAALIFSVGIIGNVSVMCIVCHNYYMRSISNSLLANLALWDFVIIFFCLPLVVFHELTKNWLLGEFSCRIIPYLEVRGEGEEGRRAPWLLLMMVLMSYMSVETGEGRTITYDVILQAEPKFPHVCDKFYTVLYTQQLELKEKFTFFQVWNHLEIVRPSSCVCKQWGTKSSYSKVHLRLI